MEEFNTEEVVSRLAMADAYLAIMHKATHEGFAFIDRELAEYRDSTGKDIDIEGFTLIHGELFQESARLAVLTAFDRALTEARVKRGRKGRGERRRQRTQKSLTSDKSAFGKNLKPNPEQVDKDVGDTSIGSGDNISTSLILIFIIAIGSTLYASFMETNKRRGSGHRYKLRGARKTLQERFDDFCERLYAYMEPQAQSVSSTQKVARMTQSSAEKKSRDTNSKKNKQPKKGKAEKDKATGC